MRGKNSIRPFSDSDDVEEHAAETRFNIMWHRHTGQGWRLLASVMLADALRLVKTELLLRPLL